MKANKFTSFLSVFLLILPRLAAQPQQPQQPERTVSPFPITSEHESAYVAEQVNAGNPDYVAAVPVETNPYAIISIAIASYGISPAEPTKTFADDYGYTSSTTSFILTNSGGNQPSGSLAVALSGTNSDSFTAPSTLSDIPAASGATVVVAPVANLQVGIDTATFTVSNAHVSASTNIAFTVNPLTVLLATEAIADQKAKGASADAAPTLASKSTDSITVNPVSCTANNDQSVEYSISPAPDTLPSARQAFTTFFSNLQPNFVYHVYARTKESANHNAGVALMNIPVTTNASFPDLAPTSGGDPQANGYATFSDGGVIIVDNGETKLISDNGGATVTNPDNSDNPDKHNNLGGGSVIVPDDGSTIVVEPSSSDGVRIISVPDASNLSYPNPMSAVYTGAPQPVTVTGTSGMGTITVFYDNATTVPVNAGTYAVTVDIAESSLYKTTTGIALGDYAILKADGASVTYAPALSAKTSRQITVSPVNNATTNGQSVEYACATSGNILPTAWQDNTTFRALTPGTTYYIYVRSAENANHKPGSTLVSTPVTTNATSPDLATPPDGDPQDNGAPQPVTVTGPNGMGPITIFYDNAAVVPVNAGTYSVTVDIAESSLYKTATGIAFGDYVIVKADGASATYAPALSAKASRQITVNPVNNCATNGRTVGYACATFDNILPK